MSQPAAPLSLDLETRIRRSQGRTGRTHSANVKLTRTELSELEAVAKLRQKAVGEWAREVLMREARRVESDPVLTEVIATRMLMVNLLKPLVMGKTVSQEWITEAMAAVRREKRKAAQEVMQQYNDEQTGGR
jgi:hypothetical protein